MKGDLNDELIRAAKGRLMDGLNFVDLLMNTLSIGKEAAYRRLRGEVPFSFYEAAQIAKVLELSLDEVAGNSVTKGAMFGTNLKWIKEPFDYFYDICCSYRDIYTYVKDDPQTINYSATNVLAVVFHSHYENLTKFRLFRWLHQFQETRGIQCMSDIHIPGKLAAILSEISGLLREIAVSYILWDNNIFGALIQDIKYFAELNLISIEEKNSIKLEFSHMIDHAENIAYNGIYPNGNKVYIYVCNIDLESSYSYVEKPGFQLSAFHLYSIDYIHTHQPDICRHQKKWIESLKRYSTLISQCGEMQRLHFFERQRKMLEEL